MKERLSNFEFMRIVAMFMVLVLHCIDALNIWPYTSELSLEKHMGVSLFYFLSIIAVNAFVLLSGWFGIKTTTTRILSFCFQAFFWGVLFGTVFFVTGKQSISFDNLLDCFYLKDHASLFTKCYLLLMIAAPILNSFVEQAERNDFKKTLIALFAFEFFFGWLFYKSYPEINSGFSFISFLTLYLLGRYLRIYAPYQRLARFMNKVLSARTTYVIGYSLPLVIAAVMSSLLFFWKNVHLAGYISFYASPLIKFSAVMLVLYFSTLQLKSSWINRIAANVFAVYLIHMHPFVYDYFRKSAIYIYILTSNFWTLLALMAFCVVFFLACCAMNYLQVWCWNRVKKLGGNWYMSLKK